MLSNEWAQKELGTILSDLMTNNADVESFVSNGEGTTIDFTDTSMLYIPYEENQEEIEMLVFPKLQ